MQVELKMCYVLCYYVIRILGWGALMITNAQAIILGVHPNYGLSIRSISKILDWIDFEYIFRSKSFYSPFFKYVLL